MNKRFFLLLGLVLCNISFAQLSFWTTEHQPELILKQKAITASFKAKTGISVEIVPIEQSELSARVDAAFSSGNLPDIISHSMDKTLDWATAGILDAKAATDVINDLGLATFRTGPIDLVRQGSEIAAVPSSAWSQLLIYRKDLFEAAGLEPPTNFSAIKAAIDVLHNPPEIYGFVAATKTNDDYMMQVLETLFLANGMNLVDAEGKLDIDRNKTLETLSFYKTLAEASPQGNLFWEQSRQLYLAGQAAMIIWPPFILDELAGLRNSAPVTLNTIPGSSELAKKSGFIGKLAGPSNPEGASWGHVDYWGITVSADTESAKQFVAYMADEAYLDWLSFAPERLFPVRQGSIDEPEKFTKGWAQLEIGVDRKASLGSIYDSDTLDMITSGLDAATRWNYTQGQEELVSNLYSTQVISELVRDFIDGKRTAESVMALMQLEIEALRPKSD